MKPSSVLLFAAGLGTRMAPLTKTMPKPLIHVAGKPMLDHAIEQCGDLSVVVNVHYLADQIEVHLSGRGIAISDERDILRETGGGLKHALPLLHSNPVFTMNTDAIWRGQSPIACLADNWTDDMEALLLMIPRASTIGQGGPKFFDMDENHRLSEGKDYVFSGAQIIRTDRLSEIDEPSFSMWSLWNGMLERGTMCGAVYPGLWCDVGQPENIALAEDILAGKYDV